MRWYLLLFFHSFRKFRNLKTFWLKKIKPSPPSPPSPHPSLPSLPSENIKTPIIYVINIHIEYIKKDQQKLHTTHSYIKRLTVTYNRILLPIFIYLSSYLSNSSDYLYFSGEASWWLFSLACPVRNIFNTAIPSKTFLWNSKKRQVSQSKRRGKHVDHYYSTVV